MPQFSPRDALADYGSPQREAAAARSEAVVFALPGRTQIELRGNDRAKFLHSFCTNDIRSLTPGQVCEAFVTSVQGKILGHIFVIAGQSSLWIDSVAGASDSLVSHLEKYHINEDVQLIDRTAEICVLYVAGPRAGERLAEAGLAAARELGPCQHVEATAGHEISARRIEFLGVPGWELACLIARAEDLAGRLIRARFCPAGELVFHSLRIEAGVPWYGLDLTNANLAQEAGRTSQAISFRKGCYLGQEPIARIDALGHVNQELSRLKLSSGPVPLAGAEVLSADSTPAGRITSAAQSYGDGLPIALAMVRRNFKVPGASLAVRSGGGLIPATLVKD